MQASLDSGTDYDSPAATNGSSSSTNDSSSNRGSSTPADSTATANAVEGGDAATTAAADDAPGGGGSWGGTGAPAAGTAPRPAMLRRPARPTQESSAANLANDPEVRRNAARKPTNAFVVLFALSVLTCPYETNDV